MAIKAIQGAIYGGEALKRHLRDIVDRLGEGTHVRVGFLSAATYPAEQKRADKEGHKIAGKNAKERRTRNLGSGLHVAQVAFWNQYGTNPKRGPKIPARPFFTSMIERKSPRWGQALGVALKQTKYDAEKALSIMGEVINGQLRQSIRDWSSPPNAPRTVAQKGFNKPLIDTAVMIRSTDYQVLHGVEGTDEG